MFRAKAAGVSPRGKCSIYISLLIKLVLTLDPEGENKKRSRPILFRNADARKRFHLHEGAREKREKWKCLNFPPNDYTDIFHGKRGEGNR